LLGEKAEFHGRTFHQIGRFVPSSQMCSVYGRIDGPKPLNVRKWECPCGAIHDRDVNAAKNILAVGQTERLSASGAHVSPASQAVV
jgi:putative transposase